MDRRSFLAISAAGAAWVVSSKARAAGDIHIANVVELSGGGASNGVDWTHGLELAAGEINKAGGLLGNQLKIQSFDTQTDASVSRAMVQKALAGDPYALFGPIYSGSVKANMMLAKQAGVPQFVGAQAVQLTHLGDNCLFRANIGQDVGMQRIAEYMSTTMKVKRLAMVWVNNDFGKGGRDALLKELKVQNISFAADLPIEYGQADYAAEIGKAKSSGADAVFAYMTVEDTARFLKQAKKSALGLPIVGETTLLNHEVLALAGDAVDGAICHLSLTTAAPSPAIQGFADRFRKRFGNAPDFNAMAAYMALYAVRQATVKIGAANRGKLLDTFHGRSVTTKEEPNILMDSSWDKNGDVHRSSFIGKGENGKIVIIKTIG